MGSILGLARSPGGANGNPLQYSCLENPHGQRSLAGMGSQRVGHDWATKDRTAQHSSKRKEDFSPCLATAPANESTITQPMRKCYHPNSCFPPINFYSKQLLPTFFFSYFPYKVMFLSFGGLAHDFAMACIFWIAISLLSQVNPFCW